MHKTHGSVAILRAGSIDAIDHIQLLSIPFLGEDPPSSRRDRFSAHKIMQYSTSKHCVYHHRYHIAWFTKYRCEVLTGDLHLSIRAILRQFCAENGVELIGGVLSEDHVHMFVSMPRKIVISDLVHKLKGRSFNKAQSEFPELQSGAGDVAFGPEDISRQPTGQSRKTCYFST